ncbi:hypothetical protein H8K35_14670 [Undibacterium sp. LX40W]|uniref:NTF2 fold domain-containing protein n=1 Tax=Undibacterium nitidum TaxID=2762298 RepID=A0A923KQ84_9BURK|nr:MULTISPECIES: hypothetical protein [Undibacterium]MBC3882633.1 hypothetical protein [Undibacterium nitidum]MBC3892914.1 hypothetical protein [Undibacterium sp. LX40W]
MRTLLVVLSFIALLGCTEQASTNTPLPSNATSESFDDMLRPDDPHFSAEERRIVWRVQAYLEKNAQKSVDARYRVKQTNEGFEVFAIFIRGYSNGRPLTSPGGHVTVILHSDGNVIRYIPGE